jgi:nucleoside-diphosphate-sugar epimerase
MKILVTGADGFLGKHTVKYLKNKGHDVFGFTLNVKNNLPFETFDAIFHFAAFVGGRKGIDNQKWKILENIELDRIVFEWAETHCKKIIYPSSSASYPATLQEHVNTFMKEEENLNVNTFDMYGLSKVVAERMLSTLNITTHVMRPFSIYGPGQSMDYPLPSIIHRAKQGECSVWGSGMQTRDWVYIDDALKIFEYLLYEDQSTVLNIGTGIPLSFIEVAKIIYNEIHGKTVPVITYLSEPEGVRHRVADVSKLKKLNLLPVTTLAEGIRNMI